MVILSRNVPFTVRSASRRLLFALSISLVLPVLRSSVKAEDRAVRAEFDAMYAKIVRATKARDAHILLAMGTPDFTIKEHGQTLNAGQATKILVEQFKMFKSVSEARMTIKQLTVKGGKAVALVDYLMKAVVAGPDGKPHALADSGVTRDTWVKTTKGWRLHAEETLSENGTMDGKPIPAEGGG